VGVTLVCLFALISDQFHSIIVKYDRSSKTYITDQESLAKCHEYRILFEEMLIAESWINQDIHSKQQMRQQAPIRITRFMTLYKKTLNRTEGNGLKIPKFHQLKHLPRYILKFGVPNNFSTSRCESHHISLSKRPAKTAQKRDECFEQQVGERIIDSIVLSKATSAILTSFKKPVANRNLFITGTKFTIVQLEHAQSFMAAQCNSPFSILPFPEIMINDFANELSNLFPAHEGIPCFTEHKRPDQHGSTHLFRGHPLYRGKPWHDWAIFRWELDDVSTDSNSSTIRTVDIPGRILFFLDAWTIIDNPRYDPALYAVIESLDKPPMSVVGSKIVRRARMSTTARYHLCNTEAIVDVAFVFPNVGSESEYYIVSPPNEWPNYFI